MRQGRYRVLFAGDRAGQAMPSRSSGLLKGSWPLRSGLWPELRVLHVELRPTASGPRVIEVNVRPAGRPRRSLTAGEGEQPAGSSFQLGSVVLHLSCTMKQARS
jgi:hypothetical protein